MSGKRESAKCFGRNRTNVWTYAGVNTWLLHNFWVQGNVDDKMPKAPESK
jgi:hypothetical protein